MGLLKDTYIIENDNDIDMSGFEEELKIKNDIEERKLKAKNRVNISLTDYEELKKEVKEKNNLIKEYETFINNLAMKIKIDPKILIKGRVFTIEITTEPCRMKQYLNVVWEYDFFDVDLNKQRNNDIKIELLKAKENNYDSR